MNKAGMVLVGALALFATASTAQQKTPPSAKTAITMDRYEGGSMVTELGYSIKLNDQSGLKREWFVIRDETAPAVIDGVTGVNVIYKSGDRHSGEYRYRSDYSIKVREPISAYEVRYHVMDVFGRHLKTLSATKVADVSNFKVDSGEWRIFSENEASEAFVSIAYIAQVRTAAGRVYEIDRAATLDQIRKVSKRMTEADMEPKRDGSPKP